MTRILSLIVAIAYLLTAYFVSSPAVFLRIIYFVLIALACIWFGDPLGRITGFRWLGNINISETTPGSIIKVFGWMLLLLVPAILLAFS